MGTTPQQESSELKLQSTQNPDLTFSVCIDINPPVQDSLFLFSHLTHARDMQKQGGWC